MKESLEFGDFDDGLPVRSSIETRIEICFREFELVMDGVEDDVRFPSIVV